VSRLVVVSGLALWLGATLLLSLGRWFSRVSLADRLRVYGVAGPAPQARPGVLTAETFREAVAPLARRVGDRLARILGIGEDLGLKLRRVHAPTDVTAFRLRQAGYAVLATGLAALVVAAAAPPLPIALLGLCGAPLLSYVLLEQQVAGASRAWQRQVFLELPVVTEQMAMLLAAGYSVSGALQRVAARGHGACARDLVRVLSRMRQGLSEGQALREWAGIVRVDAVDRLVPVLELNREAGDLGRLLSEEARAIRRDVHRELIERIERRGQQVWIPVTVAALLPGVVFLAVPFVTALQVFAR
jgi:tight adherence protein C